MSSCRHTTLIAFFSVALLTPLAAGAEDADAKVRASVTDLAWITGAWTGQLGKRRLEETWTAPNAGTIAAVVRISGEDATDMVELLVIREEKETLTLLVQPWNPKGEPGNPGMQRMVLAELGTNRARFKGTVAEQGFKTLTYSRPSPAMFKIEVETQDGQFSVDLIPRTDTLP